MNSKTNSKTWGKSVFQGMGWMSGIVGMLFIVSAGLELFAEQELRQASLATILLVVYLAALSFVLGMVSLVVLTVRWLVQSVAPVVPNRSSRESVDRSKTAGQSKAA